jgi:Leucine-rich repeat (LRR) protein
MFRGIITFCRLLVQLALAGLLQQAVAGTVPIDQVEALGIFYNATNGPDWDWKSNYTMFGEPWDVTSSSANPCLEHWQGVTCTANCNSTPSCDITGLQLEQFNITGTLSASLGALSQLIVMDFTNNQLSGTFPAALGSLAALTMISFNGNRLSGSFPSAVGLMTNLGLLDMSFNFLTGTIPAELGSLRRLT